jgi:glycosyltransferase involved in cell wall biosynthesis
MSATAGPLRLAVVSPTGLMSGAEQVLLRAVAAAVGQGWQVEAACPDGPLVAALVGRGARVEVLPDLKLPAGPRAVALLWLAWRTLRAVPTMRAVAGRSQVILVNGFFALPALRLARPKAPVGWLVHDVLRKRKWAAAVRAGRACVTLAIAVSAAVAEPLVARNIPVKVVRNGTPWPVAAIDDDPAGPPLIGCVALLSPWKGQDVLLEAVARLPEDLQVELVGGRFPKDGPFVDRLQVRASRSDLAGRVRFVGRVEDPLPVMRRWKVAVSASVEPEAGPLAVLEAMSIGLPLVGTDHGGLPEVLGEAGLLVPPGDPAAMAEAIARLLSDRELWLRCHRAGPPIIAAGLDEESCIAELLSVLAGLAGREDTTEPDRA